jgi:hypothetical protein
LAKRAFEKNASLNSKATYVSVPKLSIPNPLHIFEQDPLTAAIIKFRGPAIGVASDSLRGFEGAIIFQKVRDTCRAK